MEKELQYKILDKICPFRCGKGSTKRTRHEFFDNICTEIQAYILGLHAADGCVEDKKQMFRFRVQTSDVELIYLIKDTIGKDARIAYEAPRAITNKGVVVGHNTGNYCIDIYSKKIKEDLTFLNMGQNKTNKEIPLPKLSDELLNHFIRGYFDGDGCFSWAVCKKNQKYTNWCWRKISIVSKTKTLLSNIQDYLNTKGIDSRISLRKNRNNWVFEISRKASVEKFFRLIYDNANFYLTRKYQKFDHFVNTEITQLIAEYCNAQKVNVSNSNNPSTSAEHPIEE